MMEDEIELKVHELTALLDKGVTREHVERVYSEFDESKAREKSLKRLGYEVLEPDAAKAYDENIETYAYILRRDNVVTVFQPHLPGDEGMTLFSSRDEAEDAAKAHVELIVSTEVSDARENALLESLR
jgi:hypothetical protein